MFLTALCSATAATLPNLASMWGRRAQDVNPLLMSCGDPDPFRAGNRAAAILGAIEAEKAARGGAPLPSPFPPYGGLDPATVYAAPPPSPTLPPEQ